MKTKLKILLSALLSAMCLTLAPMTWADEIDVELDIIDNLKDVEEFEFTFSSSRGWTTSRTSKNPTSPSTTT